MANNAMNNGQQPQQMDTRRTQTHNSYNGGENINVNQFFSNGEQVQQGGNKYCPSCGNQVASDAMFCSKCGTKIGFNNCPTCGSPLDINAMFCSKCGTKVK